LITYNLQPPANLDTRIVQPTGPIVKATIGVCKEKLFLLPLDGACKCKTACILFPPVNNWINNLEEQLLETVDEDVIPELIKWHSN
jgi:hypothetical protein